MATTQTISITTVSPAPVGIIAAHALARLEWDAALANFFVAKARRVAADAQRLADNDMDPIVDAEDRAFDLMMKAPAPDLAAVTRKLELAMEREEDCDMHEIGSVVLPVLSDLRRLVSN